MIYWLQIMRHLLDRSRASEAAAFEAVIERCDLRLEAAAFEGVLFDFSAT